MPRVVEVVVLLCVAFAGPARGADAPAVGDYLGPTACAAQNCHGSVKGRPVSRTVLQNEYATWHAKDRHAKAYAVLEEPRSVAIARRLGMREAPSASARCLDCHATNAPAAARGPKFRIEDGVGCESCHGPAGGWITRHTEQDWNAADSHALGLIDTTRPAVAARACMGCHYGSAKAIVDHEMLAAGHPPLVFELDTFGVNMTPHWKRHPGNEAWYTGGAWAAGQAVALREAAERVARRPTKGGWPEFSLYDCHSCHHDIGRDREGSWVVRGTRGTPPVDGSPWSGLPVAAAAVAPDRSRLVREAIARLEAMVADGQRGAPVQPTADAAAREAATVVTGTPSAGMTRRQVDDALWALTAPPDTPTFREAQQTAWGIDAMIQARAASDPPVPETERLQGAVRRMFDGLRTARGYDPSRFRSDVASVRAALGPR